MERIALRLAGFVNRINTSALIVVVMSIFYLGCRLFFNEEVYFGIAKAWADPSWIPGNTVFSDFAGTRILFQAIFGNLLRYISFEQLAFFGRLLGYILLAMPLAAIARELKLNNIFLLFWLTLFFIPQKGIFHLTPQSFYAGEWIFGGFETKTIAYVFVFWSVRALFRKNYLPAVILGTLSIYWHMLVGGWYMLYVFIYILISPEIRKKIFIYAAWAALIVIPFVIWIYNGLVKGSGNIINGVNIGYVYAYIRNPQHIGILKNWEYFSKYHAGKVLVAIIAFAISLTVYRKQIPEKFRWLNTFVIIILAQNLLFLIVALFDKNGIVGKFYPWRGSSMAMFFFQVSTLVMLRHIWLPHLYISIKKRYISLGQRKFYLMQMGLALLFTLISLGFKIDDRIQKERIESGLTVEVDKVAAKLKTVSEKSDCFMFLGDETLQNISIPRKAERDVYYMFRFVPSQSEKIYEWYCRGQEQEKLTKDLSLLCSEGLRGKVKFLVSTQRLDAAFLREEYHSGEFWIYRINIQ
jgi:hypothetical protein